MLLELGSNEVMTVEREMDSGDVATEPGQEVDLDLSAGVGRGVDVGHEAEDYIPNPTSWISFLIRRSRSATRLYRQAREIRGQFNVQPGVDSDTVMGGGARRHRSYPDFDACAAFELRRDYESFDARVSSTRRVHSQGYTYKSMTGSQSRCYKLKLADRRLKMLTVLLLLYMRVGGMPIYNATAAIPSTAPTVVYPRCDCSSVDGRTVYEIVRSCLVTIGACVYRAIHQNIPDPELSFWGRLGVTIKVTFCALIAPELIIWWAMRQWFGAKRAVRDMKEIKPELKWTHTHGQFAQMGGFARKDNKRVLHPMTLCDLVETGQIDIDELQVTEKEINDKSKGDILSKTLVAFQTTWFVVTLAFATLNVITYALWWYKPLNVLCPIYIRVGPKGSHLRTEHNGDSSPQVANVTNLQEDTVGEEGISNGCRQVRVGIVERNRREIQQVIDGLQDELWPWTLWKWLTAIPLMLVGSPLGDMLGDENDDIKATHVSTFFANRLYDTGEAFVQVPSSLVGLIFGGIHFLSWNSTFPTHTELLLWRYSCTILVAVPLLLLLRGLLYFFQWNTPYGAGSQRGRIGGIVLPFIEMITVLLGPIPYTLARSCILVIAFLTLHDLPAEAFTNVSWTSYIPHL
ncbi:hypothetical protein BDN72DRAFT_860393 [Pluteus cervinus]|uniref:Uncharacterized protein n=1 Tax=Pluteus cervinus TaxID=181527 RepID=A0ACD3AJE3_9AGAR|nr:hypothetical protein BDN72DRAFT_860393 [Pluteus cervinus]